ncbi:ribonuclease H-like domain-containing protein [Tanacetum coccineum]
MRYIDGKKETRKLIKESTVNGPYVMKEIHDSTNTTKNPVKRLQTVDDLTVIGYDDEYQGDAIGDDQEDSMKTAMLLLARVITQHYSTPTNNLCEKDYCYQVDIIRNLNVQRNTGNVKNVQRITRTMTNYEKCSNVQCYNCNAKGHYARVCPKPRVRDSKYFQEQMLLSKKDEAEITLDDDLNAIICMMDWIQQSDNDSNNETIYDFDYTSEVSDPSMLHK